MKRGIKQGYIALAIVSFFWGTTYIASRIGTQHMPGIFVAGIRQFVSGLILVGFFLLKIHYFRIIFYEEDRTGNSSPVT